MVTVGRRSGGLVVLGRQIISDDVLTFFPQTIFCLDFKGVSPRPPMPNLPPNNSTYGVPPSSPSSQQQLIQQQQQQQVPGSVPPRPSSPRSNKSPLAPPRRPETLDSGEITNQKLKFDLNF
jgi:hypothetical protein